MNLDRLNPSRRARADRIAATGTADGSTVLTDHTDHTDHTDVAPRPVAPDVSDIASRPVAPDVVDEPAALDRRSVVAREKDAFGGVKIGSAFFGWLTATGTAVLLTALVAAGGTAVGVLNGDSVSNPDFGVTWRGTRGAIVIVAILLVAYYCGGYVAGRMARFNGLKQGLAVFAWALVIAVVVATLGAIAGTQWDALNAVTGIPRFSPGPARVTADGMLVGGLAAAAALIGAVLGGLAGMRFHRRVDRAGLGR